MAHHVSLYARRRTKDAKGGVGVGLVNVLYRERNRDCIEGVVVVVTLNVGFHGPFHVSIEQRVNKERASLLIPATNTTRAYYLDLTDFILVTVIDFVVEERHERG